MKHKSSRECPRWIEYVGCLYARFGSELFDYPMGDLKDLRQASSVQNYVDLFDELLTRVEVSEDVVSCFVRGLKPVIGLTIKMLGPRTLAKAIELARIQEQTIVPRFTPISQGNQPYPKRVAPLKPSGNSDINTKPAFKNPGLLTTTEISERSKGLCFSCDEKIFLWAYKNKRELFSLEVEDFADPEVTEEDVMVDPRELLAMMAQGLETDSM